MQKFKAGQVIEIQEDFEIKAQLSDTMISVKKGDRAFIDSRGFIHYLTGKARGKIQKMPDAEVKGVDTESIAELIIKAINRDLEFKSMLEDYDIEEKQITEIIEDTLSDIL